RVAVEGLRHDDVADEPRGVEERDEEDGIADDAVDECNDATHDCSPSRWLLVSDQMTIQVCAERPRRRPPASKSAVPAWSFRPERPTGHATRTHGSPGETAGSTSAVMRPSTAVS